ncbi:ATP-binding protein [Eubacterium oxidoreducens]|uniref:DNA replication protein DnaC n=1 Tax=Eubacterium oxidoreducens TaxID=1732 RepID=A0A1G6BVW8_EUBOX|nr:ATP-binding protein [Eubacterium oxidoreducens]SDB24752.1 DNA replication protein DnaC [Eubacterium oxidoreducens]
MPLTNSQFSSIMREYEERQQHNHREELEKKEALYAREPRFLEIDNQIASLSIARIKAGISKESAKAADLEHQLENLKKEKENLFHFHGLTPQDLEPSYTCPDCKDTGYIGNQKCHCLKQACIDLVYSQSNIKQILSKESFSNFSLDYYPADIVDPATKLTPYQLAQNAYEAALEFVRNFDTRFENLIFTGDTGVGKTFLSNCIARELLNTGHSVIYFSADQLFNRLIQSRFERATDGLLDSEQILDCDLLIIDDLGTEFGTGRNSGAASQLFTCINERIIRRKSTIISTNLSLQQIADTYTERIFSRLSSNYELLKLIGNDIRIQKKIHV